MLRFPLAAFVWVWMNRPSCRPRRRNEGADDCEDLAEVQARYSHLGQLECDLAGTTPDPRGRDGAQMGRAHPIELCDQIVAGVHRCAPDLANVCHIVGLLASDPGFARAFQCNRWAQPGRQGRCQGRGARTWSPDVEMIKVT